MPDTRTCNRCHSPTRGVCQRCGCPEFTLHRDPQRTLPFPSSATPKKEKPSA